MNDGLGTDLLRSRAGVAFLVAGEASGRLDEALDDRGLTLCLAAHAKREVARGADGGRLAELLASPPAWLREAAERVDARPDLDWWSRPASAAVHRQVADGLTGIEVVDHAGRARSLAEEAPAHLHTFATRDNPRPIARWRPDASVRIEIIDRPSDWERLGGRLSRDADGHHLTLRGALTVTPATGRRWPWELAGVWWNNPVPGTPLPDDEHGQSPHDHDWVSIGRPHDPRFDEGDEVDGSDGPTQG